jgi:hypothetical protein
MRKEKITFSFGQHITVFQAEVYATEACTMKNLDGGAIEVETSAFYLTVKS